MFDNFESGLMCVYIYIYIYVCGRACVCVPKQLKGKKKLLHAGKRANTDNNIVKTKNQCVCYICNVFERRFMTRDYFSWNLINVLRSVSSNISAYINEPSIAIVVPSIDRNSTNGLSGSHVKIQRSWLISGWCSIPELVSTDRLRMSRGITKYQNEEENKKTKLLKATEGRGEHVV